MTDSSGANLTTAKGVRTNAADAAAERGRAGGAMRYTLWPSAHSGNAGQGDSEFALSFGAGSAVRLLVIPSLFDEANKLRRFTAELMRRLALSGIDSVLPDLPGCNESRAPLNEQTLASWRDAVRSAAEHFRATHVLTIRAGALLAPPGFAGWRYAPTGGKQILRSMLRARTIAAREAGRDEPMSALQDVGRALGLTLGGWQMGATLFTELENAATPAAGSLIDIAQDTLGGPGLWLRAEPDEAPEQTDALAGIIAVSLDSEGKPGALEPSSDQADDDACAIKLGERQMLTFSCGRRTLGATLDNGDKTVGILCVSGGNEVRAGAFNGQAMMAARLAAHGYPVMRFDRRGIGDSDGENAGFRGEGDDIAAALAAFRTACPGLKTVYGFGNCDAASALMLSRGDGFDGLILSNPWTFDADDGDIDEASAQAPDALRARYIDKLKHPSEIKRLLTGGVNLRKLAKGLGQARKSDIGPSALVSDMMAGLDHFDGAVAILLAGADRTAQAFASMWPSDDPRIRRCDDASHAYVEPASFDWLEQQILAVMKAAES